MPWGYCGYNGPATWPNNIPAAGGKMQSPIDIITKDAVYDAELHDKPLVMGHSADSADEIINTGASVQITYDCAGSYLEGGPLKSRYQLKQFHFHWGTVSTKGSEHTVDGTRFAEEVHLVHVNVEKYQTFEEAVRHPDGLCVLGAFLKPGKSNTGMKKLTDLFSHIKFKGQKHKLGPFDPEIVLPADRSKYWTYPGSLTTPPCLECVTWIVFKEPIEASEDEIEAFRHLWSIMEGEKAPVNEELHGHLVENYRPPCALNDRVVRASFK